MNFATYLGILLVLNLIAYATRLQARWY